MPFYRETIDHLTFASEAEIVGLWGIAALVIALIALIAERRRLKNIRTGTPGWVPWTGIFLTAAVVGAMLLMLALKGLAAG